MNENHLETVWRLVGVSNWPNRLDVKVVVETTATVVVDAIEEAAAGAGVQLVRVDPNQLQLEPEDVG